MKTDMKNKSVKRQRQAAIRDILQKMSGTTHEDIKDFLDKVGIKASQATISRDMREMGVVKIPLNGSKAFYRLHEPVEEFNRTISNYPISYEAVGNLLVIKTTSGSAPGFCVILDNQKWDEIVGTVAGDDTILIILRNQTDAASVIEKLENII